MWSNKALGKNGIQYLVLLYSLPILPLGVLTLFWYMTMDNDVLVPLPIALLIILTAGVLLHQVYEVFKFIKIASKTAKTINVTNTDLINISLFSNKVITLKDFTFTSSKGLLSENLKYKGLFTLNQAYVTISNVDGSVYYISDKHDGYNEICNSLYTAIKNT
jgi:hypothetical protein